MIRRCTANYTNKDGRVVTRKCFTIRQAGSIILTNHVKRQDIVQFVPYVEMSFPAVSFPRMILRYLVSLFALSD